MSALKPQDTRALARGAIIAALYTALTVLLAPLSYGEVQIRFSEAFTLLPILMPEAVPALLVGGLLALTVTIVLKERTAKAIEQLETEHDWDTLRHS